MTTIAQPPPVPHWVAFGTGPFVAVPAGLTREEFARWETAQCEALEPEPCDYDDGDQWDGDAPGATLDEICAIFGGDMDALIDHESARG